MSAFFRSSSSIRAWVNRVREKHGAGALVVLAFLAVLLIVGIIFLIEAEKPWGRVVRKRLDRGLELDVREYGIIGLWWGALINIGIVTFLLATHAWWLPVKNLSLDAWNSVVRVKLHRCLLIGGTLLAFGFGLCERLPRMTQSLWNDEEYAMRRYAHGAWEKDEKKSKPGEESWYFKPAPWDDTLFENTNGNNHLIDSFLMRASLSIWRGINGEPREAFSEAAVRTPSFIAGMLTLVMMVLLGIELGIPVVGVMAALWLAVSPWHIRYSTDGKGYGEMMFFMTLHLYGLLRALREGKLRWWLLFAGGESCYILSFAGSIYVAISVNAMACVELLRRSEWRRIGTLIGFNLLAAIPVVQWMLPSVTQIQNYLNRPDALRLGMDYEWLRDLLASLYVGVSHDNPFVDQHFGTGWVMLSAGLPWVLKTFSLVVVPVLILLGIIEAWRRGPAGRLILWALTIAAVLSFVHNQAQDHPMVVWYLVHLILVMSLAVPLGIHLLTGRRWPKVSVALMLPCVFAYAVVCWDANVRQKTHDRQPMRQTVAYIRDQAPEALTGSWGISDRQTQSYDPRVTVLAKDSDLDALIARARSEKKPLYVYACGEQVTIQRRPEMTMRVKSSGEFELVNTVRGLEELFTYKVYRLKE